MKTSAPLYHQLKNTLLQQLQSGQWNPGDLIPSEQILAEQYHVSRTTVRQAVGDLVSSGYLIRQQGKGTFVARRNPTMAASPLYGFAEELQQRGHKVSVEVEDITIVACPDEVANALELPRHLSTGVIYVSRRAFSNNVCLFHEVSYLVPPPPLTAEHLLKEKEMFSNIYGFFERNGVNIGLGKQTISATCANPDDAKTLSINPGEPVLVVHRVTQDVTGTPVEYSLVRYPAHLYEYQINLHR